MNYANIKYCDIANGPGVRVSLFVSGCTHHCKGCFNSEAWDFKYGEIFDTHIEQLLLEALTHPYIAGLTILGGEPFELANQQGLYQFIGKVKAKFPTKSIWCYTGYTLDVDILPTNGKVHSEFTCNMLNCIDVLVDGEYQQDKRSLMLKFKGSSNQRIIDVPSTLHTGDIVLLDV